MNKLILFILAITSVFCTESKKPNIIFILADDWGYGDMDLYPSPLKDRIPTPNLNKLASQGMLFTQAYAGYSVCGPSRRTLMTGYHSGHQSDSQKQSLPVDTITVPRLLKESAGYSTAHFGKWGLGNIDQTGAPTLQGFDYYYGQTNQGACHNYYPYQMQENLQNIYIDENKDASEANCGFDHDKCSWTGDIWNQKAIEYIKNNSNSEQPWFVYLAYTAPHAGNIGNDKVKEIPIPRVSQNMYANETWKSSEIDFATSIVIIDQLVGDVLDTLKSEGIEEETLVFFSSDNGAHNKGGHNYQFFNSSGYLNGYKRSVHDGGHRANLIARWPGVIAQNVTTQQQWAFYDFLPTVCDIAGVTEDKWPSQYDGYSIKDTLFGTQQSQPKFIYHDYAKDSGALSDPVCKDESKNFSCNCGQNIRYGNWSGVCIGEAYPCTGKGSDRFWLYDMSVDQAQTKDLSKQHPEVVETILGIMADQYNHNWPNITIIE